MTRPTIDDVITATEAIMDRINDDNARHGGLLSRETIRTCDEARLVISRYKTGAAVDPLADVWNEVEGEDYDRGT